MIPLYDEVTILKQTVEDEWNITTEFNEVKYKCMVSLDSKLIMNQNGKEVATTGSVLLKGLVQVTYNDTIVFTDVLGNTYKKKPIQIKPLMNAGKVLFTKVFL